MCWQRENNFGCELFTGEIARLAEVVFFVQPPDFSGEFPVGIHRVIYVPRTPSP